MPIFRVNVPTTGFVSYEVEADDVDGAKSEVLDGGGEYDSRHSESNEDIDSNNWDVFRIK